MRRGMGLVSQLNDGRLKWFRCRRSLSSHLHFGITFSEHNFHGLLKTGPGLYQWIGVPERQEVHCHEDASEAAFSARRNEYCLNRGIYGWDASMTLEKYDLDEEPSFQDERPLGMSGRD